MKLGAWSCLRLILLAGLASLGSTPLHAGASAADRVGVERYGDQRIRDLALRLNEQLDDRKVSVAILARAGRPRSALPSGIAYTHVAFAVFERLRANDGTEFYSYAVYNLYQGGKGSENRSTLKQDLIYDFVAGILEPDVAVCVPIDALQKRLGAAIRSPVYRALHIPDYNVAANPWVERFDNCVTHSLKICVAAIYDTTDRARIYGNIRTYFQPTPVRLGPLQSLGSAFVPDLSREDCDPRGLQTATFESLKAFLENNGLVRETFTVVAR
jgi:hypothetical protein